LRFIALVFILAGELVVRRRLDRLTSVARLDRLPSNIGKCILSSVMLFNDPMGTMDPLNLENFTVRLSRVFLKEINPSRDPLNSSDSRSI